MSIVYNAVNNEMIKKMFMNRGRQGPINPLGLFHRSKPNLYLGPKNDMPPVDPKTGLPSFKGKPEWYPSSVVDAIAFNHDVSYNAAEKYEKAGKKHIAKYIQRQADQNMILHLNSYAKQSGLSNKWKVKACLDDPEYCIADVGIKSKMAIEDAVDKVKGVPKMTDEDEIKIISEIADNKP